MLLTLFPVADLAIGISKDGVDAKEEDTGDDIGPCAAAAFMLFTIQAFRCDDFPSPASGLAIVIMGSGRVRTCGRLIGGVGKVGRLLYTCVRLGLEGRVCLFSGGFMSSLFSSKVGGGLRSSLLDISLVISRDEGLATEIGGLAAIMGGFTNRGILAADDRSLALY